MSTRKRREGTLSARTIAILAAGIILLCAAAPPARAGNSPPPLSRFRFLAPTENAVLPPGDAWVIGSCSGEGPAMLQVSLDGKLAKFVTATGGGFWCRLALPPGRHAIRVSSGKDEATLPVVVAPAGDYRYHPQVENCEGCHPRPGGGPFKTEVPLAGLCGKCHKPRDAGKFVHGPVAAGGCTACHDPHGARNPRLQKTAFPCSSCHPPFPAAARTHGPLGRGECVSCHNPHSADDKALLVLAGNALCVSCHREFHPLHRTVAKEGTMIRVPEDFPRDKEMLACAGCHAPHRSDEEHLLRVKADRLCRTCHS